MDTENKTCHIAIVPSIGLGDALLFLIIANNLQRNGFVVSFFSNYLTPFQEWLPQFHLRNKPSPNDAVKTYQEFDLVIAEKRCEITTGFTREQINKLANRYLFLNMSGSVKTYTKATKPEQLIAHVGTDKQQQLKPLLKGSGVSIKNLLPKAHAVDCLRNFCANTLSLKDTTRSAGFHIPANLQKHRYPKRIIIHPTSSNPVKNWSMNKFIKLAIRLKKAGFEPSFILAPNERAPWEERLKGVLKIPCFANLADVAAHIYESGVMVGNDSGIGQLTNALGINNIMISMRRKICFWKPAWVECTIVAPFSKLKFAGKYHWQKLISVRRVFKTVVKLQSNTKEE